MIELDEMNNTLKKIYTLNGEYYLYPVIEREIIIQST